MKRIFGTREKFLEVLVGGIGIMLLIDSVGQWIFTQTIPGHFGSNLVFGVVLLAASVYKRI